MTTKNSIENDNIKELFSNKIGNYEIWSLNYCKNNSILLVGCTEGNFLMLDAQTLEIINNTVVEIENQYEEIVKHTITRIAVEDNKELIIVATRLGFAVLNFNLEIMFSDYLLGWVFPLVKFSNNKELFAISDDRRTLLYKTEGFELISELDTAKYTMGIEFSRDDKFLYAGGGEEGEVIQIWDLEKLEKVNELNEHTGPILDLAISEDDKTLISSAEDFSIKKWDLEKNEPIEVSGFANGKENQILYSPDFSVIATACLSRVIALRDPETLEMLWHERFDDYVTSVSFSNDGSKMAVGEKNGTLKVWDIGT
jgi:WD40 repeat protein